MQLKEQLLSLRLPGCCLIRVSRKVVPMHSDTEWAPRQVNTCESTEFCPSKSDREHVSMQWLPVVQANTILTMRLGMVLNSKSSCLCHRRTGTGCATPSSQAPNFLIILRKIQSCNPENDNSSDISKFCVCYWFLPLRSLSLSLFLSPKKAAWPGESLMFCKGIER